MDLKSTNRDQVVVQIQNEPAKSSPSPLASASSSHDSKRSPIHIHASKEAKDPTFELTEMDSLRSTAQPSNFTTISSPDAAHKFSASPARPPKVPDKLTRRKTLARSAYSKPKSRFVEPSGPVVPSLGEEGTHETLLPSSSPYRLSPGKKVSFTETPRDRDGNRTAPITPRTPLMASPGGDDEDEEDEEIYKIESVETKLFKSRRKWRFFVLIEWVALVVIWACLIASLTVPRLKHLAIWGLEVWKWCVLVMVIVCGRLMSKWFVHVSVFLIEKNFLL